MRISRVTHLRNTHYKSLKFWKRQKFNSPTGGKIPVRTSVTVKSIISFATPYEISIFWKITLHPESPSDGRESNEMWNSRSNWHVLHSRKFRESFPKNPRVTRGAQLHALVGSSRDHRERLLFANSRKQLAPPWRKHALLDCANSCSLCLRYQLSTAPRASRVSRERLSRANMPEIETQPRKSRRLSS